MIYRTSVRVAAICFFASSFGHAGAQTPAINKYSSSTKESTEKKTLPKRRDSAAVAEEQRAVALSIITSLAEESKAFKDQSLRVRVQARAADILWESDRILAQDLFLRAWETAEIIDKEGATEESRRKLQTSTPGLTFIPPAPNLRSEVLNLAARRDRLLGETLLTRLEEAKEQETATGSGVTNGNLLSFFDPTEPALAIAKRLELATELIKMGEIDQAKMFADPGLNYVTSQGIIFLCTLRQKDAGAADERYSRLLTLSANDHSADATTVSLLSSYLFTPNLIVTATRRGRVSNPWNDTAATQDLPAGLRASFLRVAAQILLRPLPPPEQDRTSAGRAGTYFTITRLLPIFEKYAPDRIPALSERLAVLAPDTPEVYRNNDNGMLTAGLVPETPGRDDLSDILSQLSTAISAGERDLVYAKAIRAAMKGDGRVREFADRIENTDLRKRARFFADFVAVRKALDEKDVEGAVHIIRAGELPPLHRVWAYSEAANLLKDSDASRAIQLLNDAGSVAYSINSGETERVYALARVASHFFRVDRVRAWEVTADVVRASNAVAHFAGDDGKLTAQLQTRTVVAMVNLDVPSFNLAGLFELLAKDDFQRAISSANGLKGEAPRSTANLAIARSLLGRQMGD